MKRLLVFPLLVAMLFVALQSSAKDAIDRIEIRGTGLESPIEITDRAIVSAFSIWIGPGVRVNGQPVHLDPDNTEGMFIDWPKGMSGEVPPGLERFDVTFWLESAPVAREMHGWYVFTYGFDRSTAGGYIHLPGKDDDGYRRNVSSIIHGVEGNWFHSSARWEDLVRPLIEKASDHGGRMQQTRR